MTGWPALTAELDVWSDAGQHAILWWRDDDAVMATPQLAHLLRLAGGTPVAVAVIPAFARPELAGELATRPQIGVLQHGWQHVNRARDRDKKSEFPPGRPMIAIKAEIAAGRERLAHLFGPQALAVFVPPWNRIADEFLTLLPNCAVTAVSAMAGGRLAEPPAGLRRIDADLDLVDWRGGRKFVGEEAALRRLIGLLQQRRANAARRTPIGLLTHHLILDRGTTAFMGRLIDAIDGHRAAHWASVGDLL